MDSEVTLESEFIIPTRYKYRIGSYLSWPAGARELTKALSDVPQLKEIQLGFRETYPKHPKGKWPSKFCVLAARYSYERTQYAKIPGINDANWDFEVYSVPRETRAEIRSASVEYGFRRMAEWLSASAKISGSEGYLSFEATWDADSKELTFGTREYALPETSAKKGSKLNGRDRDQKQGPSANS